MILAALALLTQDPLALRADTLSLRHDALRYDVAIALPDTGGLIRAEVAIRWRLTAAEPIRLELDTALTVTGATLDGRPAAWHREGPVILIPHDRRPGDTAVTTVAYTGVPQDGLVIRGGGRGESRTVFGDNWPDRGHRWLASQDHPSDKAAVGWRITAPLGLTVVAVGRLVRVDTAGSTATWTFDLPEPTPVHTMVLGAARLAIAALPPAACAVRCVPVSVVSYPTDSAWAVAGPFRRAGEMVELFSRLFGPFPFPELRHVQSSTRFGGMENSSAIFYDERAWQAHRLGEGTVAHETAHQWFGDAVSQADWHHLWLSEGFATYGAALWAEHTGGAEALRTAMRRAADAVRQAPVRARPILDPGERNLMALLSANNYQKGSWVLHSLRGLVGDSVFFQGLAAYYARFAHGNVLSRDFADAMARAAGRDLDWYFRQALTQPGYPILEIAARPAGDSLHLEIRQVQDAGWGLYRLPGLQVRVNGQSFPVDVEGAVTRRVLPAPGGSPAPAVEVDPDGWWLLEVRKPEAP